MNVLFACLLIMSMAASIDGLSCFGCDSTSESSCGDLYQNLHKHWVQCVDADIMCAKITSGVGLAKTVRRGCAKSCTNNKSPEHGTFCCKGDYCNGSRASVAGLLAVFAGVAAVRLLC